MSELSIVIVNWNSKDYVRNCLRSIASHPTKFKLQLIVIDGASFDGCGEMLSREFPYAGFIQLSENRGFGHANNVAFASVRSPYVLFLNPDTEVRKDAIGRLLHFHQTTPGAGIAGAKLLNTDGTLQTSCVQAFATPLNQALNCDFLRRRFPRSRLWGTNALLGSAPAPVEGISGACMLMKSALFAEIGGFNPEYFMYSEDMELSWAALRAGYVNYYVPDAEIVHHGGGSSLGELSTFSAVEMLKAAHHFICKRSGRMQGEYYRAAMALSALLRIPFLAIASICSNRPFHGRHILSLKRWWARLGWCVLPKPLAIPGMARRDSTVGGVGEIS